MITPKSTFGPAFRARGLLHASAKPVPAEARAEDAKPVSAEDAKTWVAGDAKPAAAEDTPAVELQLAAPAKVAPSKAAPAKPAPAKPAPAKADLPLGELGGDANDDETSGLGAHTQRLLGHSVAEESLIRGRKRVWRLTCWLSIVLLTSGAWSLYTMGSKPYTVTKRYDPAVGLDLELGGCDLDFVPGDEPTIRYRAVAGGARARWDKRSTDASITTYAHLENNVGCSGLRPATGCRRHCLVTVTVPAAAAASARFRVDQDPDDLEAPQLTLTAGTRLAALSVSPKRMPRSLHLAIDGATIHGALQAKLGFGEVQVRCDLPPSPHLCSPSLAFAWPW